MRLVDFLEVLLEARVVLEQIDDVPEDAMPPREPGEPVSHVATIPEEDPPVY